MLDDAVGRLATGPMLWAVGGDNDGWVRVNNVGSGVNYSLNLSSSCVTLSWSPTP